MNLDSPVHIKELWKNESVNPSFSRRGKHPYLRVNRLKHHSKGERLFDKNSLAEFLLSKGKQFKFKSALGKKILIFITSLKLILILIYGLLTEAPITMKTWLLFKSSLRWTVFWNAVKRFSLTFASSFDAMFELNRFVILFAKYWLKNKKKQKIKINN